MMLLNPEQLLIKGTARRFASYNLAHNAKIWEREAHLSRKELKQMGELDLMGI